LALWPKHGARDDLEAGAELVWVVDLITAVRSVRAEMNINPASEIPAVLVAVSAATRARAERWGEIVRRLAPLSHPSLAPSAPPRAGPLLVRGEGAAPALQGGVEFAAEKTRLEKEIARVNSDIARIDAKLGNADFVARAPEEVVEGEREKREEAEQRRAKIKEALERLKGAA